MEKGLLAVALLLAFSQAGFALSGVGEHCNFTYDCVTGYCANESKTCVSPAVTKYAKGSNCTITADCREGYCTGGNCIIPISEAANFLVLGPKNGCAGLTDPVSLGSLGAICDALWILLVLFALLAGFIARGEENKLIPIGVILLPLLLGLLLFSFIGVIIAIVEIALLFYKGEKKAGYVELPKELKE